MEALDRGRKGCAPCRTLQAALYEGKAECTVAGASRKRLLRLVVLKELD